MEALIKRSYLPKQTVGTFYIFNDRGGVEYSCGCLELKWFDNERMMSCIPEKKYKVIKHTSPKFGESFWIQDVPNRSEILIHDKVNFVGSNNPRTGKPDLLGCITPFKKLDDLDGDGILDIAVKSSTHALKDLLRILPNEFDLTIEGDYAHPAARFPRGNKYLRERYGERNW